MDSPSSGSSIQPALVDRRARAGGEPGAATQPGEARRADLILVAGLGNAVAAELAAFLGQEPRSEVILVAGQGTRALAAGSIRSLTLDELARSAPDEWDAFEPSASVIFFLPPRLAEPQRRWLGELLRAARRWPIEFVGIISTFRIHLGDHDAEDAERQALALVRASGQAPRVAVFRPGLVLSPHSRLSRWLSDLAPFYPLVPRRLRTCFIEGAEFFAAVEAERSGDGRRQAEPADSYPQGEQEAARPRPPGRAVGRRQRAYTLLGANLPWRDVLARQCAAARARPLATAAARLLSWLLVGELIALVVVLAAKRIPRARPWCVRTLKPRSMRELISLCHRRNIDRVRVVGYNNGVNHFGHRYPGKTIVSTVRCCRTVHAGPGKLKADCGATVHSARDYLGARGEELYVVPNYSYVSLGTAYFVPIHGSAVDYSTLAETACRVVLYDPDLDRIVSAARDQAAFQENVYNLRSRVVVLRLYLLTKPKSGYFVHRETWMSPEAGALLEAFRDQGATNVEARQAHAASARVTVSKYYNSAGGPHGPALELPRDALGRLWDQLEENPVTSFLMHALSRHLAWHTELFFTSQEFEVFWRTHGQVPLRKIQLRYIRRDGMPHSPFRDEDCVSADLFLFRYDKPAYDAYVKRTFASVRTNPGKHSDQAENAPATIVLAVAERDRGTDAAGAGAELLAALPEPARRPDMLLP